jgi:hypothetical protein
LRQTSFRTSLQQRIDSRSDRTSPVPTRYHFLRCGPLHGVLEMCQALHLPQRYAFLKTIGPNRRAIPAIAACASAFVAYGLFVHRFLATPRTVLGVE